MKVSKLSRRDWAAMLARARYMVSRLRTPARRKPWVVDEERAERILTYFRDRVAGKPDDVVEFHDAVLEFCDYYGQDLNWLLFGDPGTMICDLAARSKRAAAEAAAVSA
jgi:hypothetical protein